jgi:hypothetical protein
MRPVHCANAAPKLSRIDHLLACREQIMMSAGFYGCVSRAKGEAHALWIAAS